ncbi:hypothetical protein EV363DRAFT_1164745 [Boletus edulis]|nr:hypothetical protein EV363DRAFT_1164745 [Boletus edulis]
MSGNSWSDPQSLYSPDLSVYSLPSASPTPAGSGYSLTGSGAPFIPQFGFGNQHPVVQGADFVLQELNIGASSQQLVSSVAELATVDASLVPASSIETSGRAKRKHVPSRREERDNAIGDIGKENRPPSPPPPSKGAPTKGKKRTSGDSGSGQGAAKNGRDVAMTGCCNERERNDATRGSAGERDGGNVMQRKGARRERGSSGFRKGGDVAITGCCNEREHRTMEGAGWRERDATQGSAGPSGRAGTLQWWNVAMKGSAQGSGMAGM